MSRKEENILTSLLSVLEVKHTVSFSDKYFNEHPHKYNLYGLSKMLSDYGIRNASTRIEDKEKDIYQIELPFVAHFGSDFVVVYRIESPSPSLPKGEGAVHILRNGKKISIPVSKFIQSWSGVILLAEASSESGEPDYTAHRKKDLLIFAQKIIIALSGILILAQAYIHKVFLPPVSPVSPFSPILPFFPSSPFSLPGITSLLAVNIAGVIVCYLLVLKQMHINSRYADKICSLFGQSDCNNVLESDAAKLWGIFGWSEIGLGYFTANIIILLFLPHLIPIW